MAMIQKKNYTLRHIFLIIILIIVLFPLVWVVTTSIRRDNAAFSPKLFSSRITLNYYRDLLFPRATVPELIKDINGTSHFIGENAKLSLDEANNKLLEEISNFENYISETNNYIDDISKKFDDLKKSLYNENMQSILNDINKSRKVELEKLEKLEKEYLTNMNLSNINPEIENLSQKIDNYFVLRNNIYNLLNSIKVTEKNKKYYLNTLETLYSTNPNYILWNVKSYKKWEKIDNSENLSKLAPMIKELSNSWKDIKNTAKKIDNYFSTIKKQTLGNDLVNLNNYENEIKETQKSLSLINNEISKTESIVVKYNSDLNSLLELYAPNAPKISSAVNLFKKYKDSKVNSPKVLALSEDINYLYNSFNIINSKIQNLGDFESYKDSIKQFQESFAWLKDNLEYINPNIDYISPAFKTINEVISYIKPTIDTLKNTTINLSDALVNLEKYQNSFDKLKKQIENTQQKYDALYSKNKNTLDNFAKLEKYGEFLIIKNIANSEIKNYYDAEYFADLLNSKLFEYYKPIKKDLNIFTLRKSIEEANEKFEKSKISFKNIISQIEPNLEKLKENSHDYLKINYGGYTADISPVMEISSIYNSKFGPAKANISRASRIVSDLADSVKYKTLKSDLRTIDKNIYNLLDNWNPKQRKPFLRWLLNSIIVAGLTSIITVMITSVAAYPFSRMRFFGRKEGLLYLMLIQMFPAIMYMVALYGILKFMGDYFGFIGLDTLSGLIFVYLGGVSFNMWLIKGYYDTIPDSLEESAMIDGATRFQTFWRIVLPLASPILAVVTILSFMGTFNEFVLARIVLSSEQNYTYAVGLQTFTSGPFETEWGLFTAAALLGAIPMVLLFLSMQKYLVGGLTQGAVKG